MQHRQNYNIKKRNNKYIEIQIKADTLTESQTNNIMHTKNKNKFVIWQIVLKAKCKCYAGMRVCYLIRA